MRINKFTTMLTVCALFMAVSSVRALKIHETLKIVDGKYIQMNTNAIQQVGYINFFGADSPGELVSHVGVGTGTNAIQGAVYFNSASNTFYFMDTNGNWRAFAGDETDTGISDTYVDEAGDDMTGVLGLGGNQLTNLADATRGDMAVNYTQLTNAVNGTAAGLYVDEAGDTMTGDLTLPNDPTANLHAATKQYVDTSTNAAVTTANTYTDGATNNLLTTVDGLYVNESGDTMSGALTITAAGTGLDVDNDVNIDGTLTVQDLYAVNETVLNIVVSNTALVATNLSLQGVLGMGGNQITNLLAATRGDMAVNYTQLTNAVDGTAADLFVDEAGDTMTGDLTLPNDPTANLHAATKQYVDTATNAAVTTANTYTDGATNNLLTTVDGLYVNEAGDDMTGILGLGGNRITNVADAVNLQDAVTLSQLNSSINSATNDVDLQQAYVNGNTIATSAGEGSVTISGDQPLVVSSSGGADVTGGALDVQSQDVNVTGGAGSDVNIAAGGDLSLNGDGGGNYMTSSGGNVQIYRAGSLVMEFDGD